MKEKEIKIEIEKGIQNGISKTDLYNQFKDQYEDDSLRLLLAAKPSLQNRKKYKFFHFSLSIIWGIFLALELLNVLDLLEMFDLKVLISIIITFYFTINIWKFNGKYFLPGIIWFILSIVNGFTLISELPEYDPDSFIIETVASGYIFILIIGIILMYYIRKYVFGYYKWFTPEKDSNGKTIFQQRTAPTMGYSE